MAEQNWNSFDIGSVMKDLTDIGKPKDLGSLDGMASPSAFEGINLPDTEKKLSSIPEWQTKWFGGTAQDGTASKGILPTGMNVFSGLAGAYLGWQQFNLAKDQLAQNKKIFNLNFANQAQSVNTQLEDRQKARVAAGGSAYESVGSYMEKNAVKQKGL